MKACVVRIETSTYYQSYGDISELHKIVPETAFEEITDTQYKELVEMTKKFPNYALVTLCEKPTTNKTIQSVLEELHKIQKDIEEKNKKQKLAESKRQKAMEAKREAKELKKLQELQAKYGIKS